MTDDIQKVREAAHRAYLDTLHYNDDGMIAVFSSGWDEFIVNFAKRLQPRPDRPPQPTLEDDAKWLAYRIGGPGEGWGMWADWLRSVVRLHSDRVAPAQPRPEPVKKTWSVSWDTSKKLGDFLSAPYLGQKWSDILNSLAPGIIRERPDLVAAEWERRVRERSKRLGVRVMESMTAFDRCDLFPELD